MKVKIKCSLKGKCIWVEGLILESPLPNDILNEIKRNTGTVEIIEKDVVLPDEKRIEKEIVLPEVKVTKTNILKMKKEDLIHFIGDNKGKLNNKKRRELIKMAIGKI